MWGSNYLLIAPAVVLNFMLVLPVLRLMKQADIVEEVGLVKGARDTAKLAVPFRK